MSPLKTATLSALVVAGCSSSDDVPSNTDDSALTYYRDTKAIIDARCATCHQVGDIGPFPLTTFEEVSAFAGSLRASIEAGTMPPWQPSDECNAYVENIDLTPTEKDTLLAWLDEGAVEGDPADAPEPTDSNAGDTFVADLSLQLPEAYTPTLEPDDYRCQLIPWPADTTQYVTGLRVTPDQRSIVHHVIVFLAGPEQVAQYQAFDAAEEGPGYTCYGGPTASGGEGGGLADVDPTQLVAALQAVGLTLGDLQSGNVTAEQLQQLLEELDVTAGGVFRTLGSWVPGIPARPYPAGTGIRVEPGSMLVAQFHYNTLTSAPVADQSVIEISTAPTVEREATSLGVLDLGWVSNGLVGDAMTIPAGEAEVQHSTVAEFDSALFASARQTLGLSDDTPLVIHNANHHMHELGTQQRSEIQHSDGSTSCVLDIPDWDFQWQGAYTLEQPIVFRPGDKIWMGCTWDNTMANQPIIDGQVRDPVDVAWGEGTSDEMCLGSFYVTAE